MSEQRDDAPGAAKAPEQGGYAGVERRDPQSPDRRAQPRGGRRATDVLKKVARFVHDLLTEPPR